MVVIFCEVRKFWLVCNFKNFFTSNQRRSNNSKLIKMCPKVTEKFPLLQNLNISLHFFRMSISNFLTREIRGVKSCISFLSIVQLPPPTSSHIVAKVSPIFKNRHFLTVKPFFTLWERPL